MPRSVLNLPFSKDNLRDRRERKGLSRRDLSRRCAAVGRPVSPQHLRRLEIGTSGTSPALLIALAAALEVEVDDLLEAGAA